MKIPFTHICTLSALSLTLAALPTSCADDDITDPAAGQYTDHVCFSTTAPAFEPDTRSDVPSDCFVLRPDEGRDSLFANTSICNFDESESTATRAQLTTSATLNSFVVSAFAKNDGAWTSFFTEEENTREGEGSPWVYTSGNTHFWPGEKHQMRFCAYSPSKASGLHVNSSMTNGVPNTLTFNVQNDVSAQVDLLAAATDEVPGDYNHVYPLEFKHICTAIQFKEGADMQPGTLKKVELAGVYDSGTYSFETDSWTLNTAHTNNFTQTLNPTAGKDMTQLEGTAITDDSDCFIMMPQILPEDAQLRVTFYDKVTGQDREMIASLAGKIWPQGRKVIYTLSITPDYKFEFTDPPAHIDAHYDIVYKTLRVSGVPNGKEWTLKASLSAYSPVREEPSIQLQSEMNEYAKHGFWLDRIINPAGNDIGSARGDATFKGKGSGDFQIAIFVPENMSGDTRDVILEASFDGTNSPDTPLTAQKLTLQQLSPALSPDGSFGWEQIENDPPAPWGFNWTRIVTYRKDNFLLNATIYGPMIEDLVTQYNAEDYTTVSNTGFFDRTIIVIDYTKLNDLSALSLNNTDGLQNTRRLYEVAGGASTGNLEKAINDLAQSWNGSFSITEEIGEESTASVALGYIMRKNKYDLKQIEKEENGTVVTTDTPSIETENIVWYLPAVDQFKTLPAEVDDPINPAVCWSSTPVNDNKDAYLGNGATESRRNGHNMRACRNISGPSFAPRRSR